MHGRFVTLSGDFHPALEDDSRSSVPVESKTDQHVRCAGGLCREMRSPKAQSSSHDTGLQYGTILMVGPEVLTGIDFYTDHLCCFYPYSFPVKLLNSLIFNSACFMHVLVLAFQVAMCCGVSLK